MTLNQLQNSLEELQNKFPEYTDLITYMKFILMWFKILAKDVRRSCDQQCTQLVCDPQELLPCNYYDPGYSRCILEVLLDGQ